MRCVKTSKQLRNRLSFHKTQELNQKTIKVVVNSKTHCITTESISNQVINDVTTNIYTLRVLPLFKKIEKVAAEGVGLTSSNQYLQSLSFL